MKFSELSAPIVAIKTIRYGSDGNTVVKRNIKMQQAKENLYMGEIREEYGDKLCDLYAYFEKYDIAFIAERGVSADESIERYFDLFSRCPIHSEKTFLAYMDGTTGNQQAWFRNTEIELARVFNPQKADEYAEKKKAQIAYREEQRAKEVEAQHIADEKFLDEMRSKEAEMLANAKNIILNGGKLENNSFVHYRTKYDKSEYVIINYLMRLYEVNVPLRTQGWINNNLVYVSIKDNVCTELSYNRPKNGKVSQCFFDCMNELIRKVRLEKVMQQ